MQIIEVVLNGKHLWIYKEDLENSEGALMPTPNHAMDTFGIGTSYAHLFPDAIMRHHEKIGEPSDLLVVE